MDLKLLFAVAMHIGDSSDSELVKAEKNDLVDLKALVKLTTGSRTIHRIGAKIAQS